MNRLLYLAPSFPPARFVACIRTWNTAKQLSRLGWKVTVVTPHPDLWRSVDPLDGLAQAVADHGLDMMYTGYRWTWLNTGELRVRHGRLAWVLGGPLRRLVRRLGFEGQVGWGPAIREACAAYQPGAFDAILATGNPYVAFSLARELSERLRCPYALDYRDLWTSGNPHAAGRFPPWIRRIERRALDGAAAVTVVCPAMGEALVRAFDVQDRLHVIFNGYDAVELAAVKPHQFVEPAVVYAGIFYPPVGVPDPVLAALRPLHRPDLKWKFHYYGAAARLVAAAAERAGIAERLVTHGQVQRAEALSAARGAHSAVVIASVMPTASLGDRMIVTGKIFELVGMGVPVLLVAPPGSDAELVITGCGRRFAGDQVADMTRYYSELLAGPRQTYQPPLAFEWSRLGMQLHQVLEAIIKR